MTISRWQPCIIWRSIRVNISSEEDNAPYEEGQGATWERGARTKN